MRSKYTFCPQQTTDYRKKINETKALNDILAHETQKQRQMKDYVEQHVRQAKGQLRSHPLGGSPEPNGGEPPKKREYDKKFKKYEMEYMKNKKIQKSMSSNKPLIKFMKSKGSKNDNVVKTDKLIYLSMLT